jgi:hypothetical protein
MDRLRRGESVHEERDRRIEQRAVTLVRAGYDWMAAVLEATRELDGDVRRAPSIAARASRAGKVSRTTTIDAIPGGLLARQRQSERADRERGEGATFGNDADADPTRGSTLSPSLRSQLVSLLGFDPARSARTAEDRASATASGYASGRNVEFAPATSDADTETPVHGDPSRAPRTLAETLALLDNPEVPSDFARQAAVAHALLAAGTGESLDANLQSEFGDRLDIALDDVRVHRDPISSVIVEALGTRAFAFGRHLFFAPGTYAPSTDTGRTLIAHELAHVAQQPAGDVRNAQQVRLGREGDHYEENADHAAGALLAGLRPQVSRGAPVAARFDGGGNVNPEGVLRKHIGHDESKAKQALKNAGAKRGLVEQIVRDSFSKERADEIIKESKGGGGGGEKAPEVKSKGGGDAKGKGGGKGDAKGKGGDKGGDGAKSKGGAKGGGGGTAPAQPQGGGLAQCGDLGITELTPDQRSLIETELAEHQAWSSASSAVGAPGSMDRFLFLMGNAGRGFGEGLAMGAGMGLVTGVIGQALQRFCPIPGLGAVFAGAMSAYGLATRDWGASGETIRNFGQGASPWEVAANSLAAISEVLDIVVNVMNVIAGIIGLISAIMWLVTIITVGVASPLAGTLSAIALGILTVSGILDNINNLILQPVIVVCRVMHAMQSDADPREIQAQGSKIAESSAKVGAAVGGFLGGKAVEAGAKRIDARIAARTPAPPDVSPPSAHVTQPDAPTAQPHAPTADAPTAQPHAPADAPNAQPHAPADAPNAQPHAQPADAPNAQPAAQPQAPAAPQEPTIWQKLKLDARTHEQRAQDAQLSWSQRLRQNMGRLGDTYGTHRARWNEQNRARHTDDLDQVPEADRARRQEIDDQRARDGAEANRRGEERTAQGNERAEQRAAGANEAAERRYAQAGSENDARLRTEAEGNARAAREQTQAADTRAQQEHAQIDRSRQELDARHRTEMESAARLEDANARAAAEENAHLRHEADSRRLDQERADVDARHRAAREAALDGQNAADQRARDAYDAAQRAREAARTADQGATDQRLQQGYDQATQKGNRVRERGERGADATRKGAIDDYHGPRQLDRGDVTSPEWSPGYSPGGAMVRDEYDKWLRKKTGMDTRSDAERRQDDEAAQRDRNMGFIDRVNRQLLHGEKSQAQRVSDARDAAQYRPDHAKNPNGERKNPHYQDPPKGSLQQLDAIKKNLQDALDAQCRADAAQKASAEEKQKHEQNDAPLKSMEEEGKKATEKVGEHKGEVGVKKDANQKQQQKHGEAQGKIGDYDSKSSQFDAVIGPMHGVERFLWIGSKVGVSHFDDMHGQIKSTLKGFEDMNAKMKKEKADGPKQAEELKGKEAAIKATDQKAQESEQGFTKAGKDVGDIKTANDKAKTEAGAAESEAKGQKAKFDDKVKDYRTQYNGMAGGLLTWAQTHRTARAGQPPGIQVQAGGAGNNQANQPQAPGQAPPGQAQGQGQGQPGAQPQGANPQAPHAQGAQPNPNAGAHPANAPQPAAPQAQTAQPAQPPAPPPPPAQPEAPAVQAPPAPPAQAPTPRPRHGPEP